MKSAFRVTPFLNPSKTIVYRVTGKLNGKRVRENLPSEAEAMHRKHELEQAVAGNECLPYVQTRLSTAQLAEAEAVFARLAGHSLTLTAAVDAALKSWAPASVLLAGEAWSAFMESKRLLNLRPDTIRNLEQRGTRLLRGLLKARLSELTEKVLGPLIFRPGTGARNRRNDLLVLSSFFGWCVKRGHLAVDPVKNLERVKVDRHEPLVLTLPECRRLLATAAIYKGGILAPYVVLALFCGLRPTELQRLTWEHVDLGAGFVRLSSDIAKMRARRLVPLSANALALLATFAVERVPIVGPNWRRDFESVKSVLDRWAPDILRHTAISMHLARHEHEGKTAAWAGNSPDIIQRHYRGLVTASDAAAFWELDGSAGAVVSLAAA